MPARPKRPPREIGWREWIALPELGIQHVKAKVDTGARTSALHALEISEYTREGARWVEFQVPVASASDGQVCAARILDEREIKNTSGRIELRYVVDTLLVLGKRHWRIELSLTNRMQMEFDVILGRTAVRRHGLLVNPGRSFLMGPTAVPARRLKGGSESGRVRTVKSV